VSVLDATTHAVVATIPVHSAFGVAVNPAGTRIYVTNQFDDTMLVIDTAANTVIASITVGDNPSGMAVNPAGTRAYVTNAFSNSVSVIDTATNTVIAIITVGATRSR
jgi:YVTN family beta-propeller protein